MELKGCVHAVVNRTPLRTPCSSCRRNVSYGLCSLWVLLISIVVIVVVVIVITGLHFGWLARRRGLLRQWSGGGGDRGKGGRHDGSGCGGSSGSRCGSSSGGGGSG